MGLEEKTEQPDCQFQSLVEGDYVLTPHKNAFNSKTSWWISKHGYSVAYYCFTANTKSEITYQKRHMTDYITMFDAKIEQSSELSNI